jgi:hypothetical protein
MEVNTVIGKSEWQISGYVIVINKQPQASFGSLSFIRSWIVQDKTTYQHYTLSQLANIYVLLMCRAIQNKRINHFTII